METIKKYIFQFTTFLLFVVVILLLFFKGCKGETEPETITITIPEQKGEFEPVINPIPETIRVPFKVVKWEDKIVYTENPVNTELVEQYKQVLSDKDSILALRLYSDAVATREYNEVLEDSLVRTDNYFKTQGKLLEFKQTYTLKEREHTLKTPKTKFRLLMGIEAGNTLDLGKFTAKGNIMFQNEKGDIFSAGYDTEQRIWIGYNKSIFKIKNRP